VRRVRSWSIIAFLGSLFTFHVTGCSLIGLTGGAILDSRHRAPRALVPGRVERFYPGDAMVLTLKDGTRVEGVYEGPARIPAEEYARLYRAWREGSKHASDLPEIGEQVSAPIVGEGRFIGFVQSGIEVAWKKKAVMGRFRENGWLTRSNGRRIHLADLRKMAETGELPILTVMRIRGGEETREVPLNDVAIVRAPGHPYAAKTGFFLGLFADAAIVAAAATYESPHIDASGCAYYPEPY
jgi:hypothetical protein